MKHKWNVVLFIVPVFVMFLFNLLQGGEQAVSQLEKRAIQAKPELSLGKLADGSFTKEYDNYFSDHFVFRNELVEQGSALKAWKGFSGDDGASLVVQKGGNNMAQNLAGPAPEGEVGSSAAEGDAAVPAMAGAEGGSAAPAGGASASGGEAAGNVAAEAEGDGDGVKQAESDTYLVLKDKGMSLYQYDQEAAAKYAKAVNTLRGAIDPKVRIYSMLVPSQVEFLEMEKYRKLNDSQREAFNYVNGLYQPGITVVPAYEQLQEHRKEYIYFRTDHHWTALGASYAYQALMSSMGEEPVPLSRYEQVEIKDFLGSAYSATLNAAMKKNPDTITIYKPFAPYVSKLYWSDKTPLNHEVLELQMPTDGRGGYAVFMGGDYPRVHITTEVHNGKRLLVVKDSYANALMPFLLPHFEEIQVVDPRYYEGNLQKLVKDKQITDVLLVNGSIVTTYSGIANLLMEKMGMK